MGNLFSRRDGGVDAIPRNLTMLSVSWLNNQFKAVAVHRGRIEGTWERPEESDGAGNFEKYLREAVQHTGYRGHSVSLVLAHPRLVQQLVDAPPVKGTALLKVIQRQAEHQKVFPGEAAWASQTSPYGKGLQRVLLHLFPRVLLNQFIQGCRANGLHLASVLPPSAMLHHQITQLPLEKGDVALLAGATGGSTTLVIGRSDGQILLARTLTGTWNDEPERLAVDLNRTILFANQQYGNAGIKGVWVFGPGAEDRAKTLQSNIQFPVGISSVPYDPFYWALEGLKLGPEFTPNILSRQLQKAPQRKVLATVVALCTLLVLAASLCASFYFLKQAKFEEANIKLLSTQAARLQSRERDLLVIDSELVRKKQIIKLILGERPPPTPTWLLAYLGEAVPSDLVITNFQIRRQEDYYHVNIAGTLQQFAKKPEAAATADSVLLLKTRLAGSPFHMKIMPPKGKPGEDSEVTEGDGKVPSWLNRVASALGTKSARARTLVQDHFEIEGFIQ
jgi:hypothetical protein